MDRIGQPKKKTGHALLPKKKAIGRYAKDEDDGQTDKLFLASALILKRQAKDPSVRRDLCIMVG